MMPERSSCEVVRESIKTDVESRGGLVLDHQDSRYKDHMIRLLGKNEIPMRHQEMFDYRFVENCIYEKMIVPNMMDYRIVSCQTPVYESFNPLDILHGYVRWEDLKVKIEGERVSDIEDFEEEDYTVQMFVDEDEEDVTRIVKQSFLPCNCSILSKSCSSSMVGEEDRAEAEIPLPVLLQKIFSAKTLPRQKPKSGRFWKSERCQFRKIKRDRGSKGSYVKRIS